VAHVVEERIENTDLTSIERQEERQEELPINRIAS
jgi:hypothetical protein